MPGRRTRGCWEKENASYSKRSILLRQQHGRHAPIPFRNDPNLNALLRPVSRQNPFLPIHVAFMGDGSVVERLVAFIQIAPVAGGMPNDELVRLLTAVCNCGH